MLSEVAESILRTLGQWGRGQTRRINDLVRSGARRSAMSEPPSTSAKPLPSESDRESEVARLSRLYAALSHINQAIVHLHDRDSLFHEVCRVLVENGGFRMAWIGWHNPKSHLLVPVGDCGDDIGLLQTVSVYADDRPEGRGPTGMAFRMSRPYVCNDILGDPSTALWRQALERGGYLALVALPVRLDGSVCATLSVYAGEKHFFQEKEVAMLEKATSDLSFALDNLAREETRRAAELAASDERRFSATMIESMPGILYFYDIDGRFLRWNKNFETVSGYTAAEIATKQPLDFFSESDRGLLEARIDEAFEKGESSMEAAFVTKDGASIPYYFTGRRVHFEGRLCLVGVGIDISERRSAEDRLVESEAKYRKLFEYAPDGIVIADSQGRYLDANASVCRMLGYSREEFFGRSAADIVVPEESPHIEFALRELGRTSEHHREWRFRRKDGTILDAEVIAAAMSDGNILAMIRDISERKLAEAERERRRQAEEADRIKSAFLATMSHELRTPLNSIIGFTGIVMQELAGPLNAEQSKQLSMVRTSARHLLALVNDVLDISKIEAGQFEVACEPFDLRRSIDKALALVAPQIEAKGLSLRVTAPPAFGQAIGDERRFEQILLNLLSNAIKFTEEGEVALAAEAVAGAGPPATLDGCMAVRIRISDSGMGIEREDLDSLFQPFKQIDSGLSRNHDGTGLGLAICHRLAGLMGGRIEAASEWGKGSVFTVTLPLHGKDAE